MASERRINPLNGSMVIIAPERAHRPSAFIKTRSSLSPENCQFCPGHENETTSEILAYRRNGSIRDDPEWWIRFIPNKFPAVVYERNDAKSHPLFQSHDAMGIHELGITREHGADFGEPGFDDNHNLTYELLWAMHERKNGRKDNINPLLSIREQYPELIFAKFFKNRGEEAGGSLDHPHIQLLAIDVIPQKNKLEFSTTFEYSLKTGRCLLCDVLGEELKIGGRIVDKNQNYAVIEPYASRFPYETWIVPISHEKGFSLTHIKARSLADIVRNTFARLNVLLNNPDYNFYICDSPLNSNGFSDQTYHWYIELSPRLTKKGGWEYDTDMHINPLAPEKAADELRKVKIF